MSTPEDLKGLYTDELKDLWSANDQMQRVLKKIAPKTSDPSLRLRTHSQNSTVAARAMADRKTFGQRS